MITPTLYKNIDKILEKCGKAKLSQFELFDLAYYCKRAFKEVAYHHHWKDIKEEQPEQDQHCTVAESPFSDNEAPAKYMGTKFYATVGVRSELEVCWYWARYWR